MRLRRGLRHRKTAILSAIYLTTYNAITGCISCSCDSTAHAYEVRPRRDTRGFDLISDALPFCRLWNRPRIVLTGQTTPQQPESACDWHPIFLRFQHHPHAFFSRIEPVRKPCGSRSTCHCHVGLSNRSAVEKMAPKVAFAKQKQLAQKAVGSRDHCTSRVCSGLVDGVAQGCNIRSPVAPA